MAVPRKLFVNDPVGYMLRQRAKALLQQDQPECPECQTVLRGLEEEKMSNEHVDPVDMVEFANGRLSPEQADAVQEHRKGCSYCDDQIRVTERLVVARKIGLKPPAPRNRVTAVDIFVATVVVALVSATAWLLWYIISNG